MVSAPLAFEFVAVLGTLLALWAWAVQRAAPPEEAVPRTITSMSQIGRIAFACIALAFILVGIAARSGEAITAGIAFVLAAAGQHWVHERWGQ